MSPKVSLLTPSATSRAHPPSLRLTDTRPAAQWSQVLPSPEPTQGPHWPQGIFVGFRERCPSLMVGTASP